MSTNVERNGTIRHLSEGVSLAPDQSAPALTTVTRDMSAEEIFTRFDTDGGVIIRDFLSCDLLQRLQTELRSFADAATPGSKDANQLWNIFHGARTKRFCGLAAKSPAFVELLQDAFLKTYADHYLLPRCGQYWLNTGQMMIVGAGEPAQMLHRDSANWPHFPWPVPEVTVSCMFALSDFDTENGATQVAPGSHGWNDPERAPTPSEVSQAQMTAGSVLLYSGNVIHAAGENRSDRWRWGMHVSWVLGWLRPEECHYMAVPIDVARKLPECVQHMLGYRSYYPSTYGGRLGLVDFDDAGRML